MTQTTNPAGLALIKRNEGCVLHAYRDVVGVVTIGFGHTGHDVYMGLVITHAQADALLVKDLASFELGLNHLLGPTPTTSNQFSAMLCLAYNIGIGAFGKSTVLREHLAGLRACAADAFLMWDKAGGQVLSGLLRRRHEERALYLTPDTK